MLNVAFPYDDFVSELEDQLRAFMKSDLLHGELCPDGKYIQQMDTHWWSYFKSRFEARNKPLDQVWSVPELVASIQKHTGIKEGAHPCGIGVWNFRMRHFDWYIQEKLAEPHCQALRLCRTPIAPGLAHKFEPNGLVVTDHMPEMVTLLDDKRSLIDATFARIKTEVCRDDMVSRIRDVTLENGTKCMVP